MRELKFRAWDKDKKKYIDPFLIDLFGNTYEVSAEESEAKGCCVIIGNPNLVIEQYTGLKDENGKEIYEGDIVKYSFKMDVRDTELLYSNEVVKFSTYKEENWPYSTICGFTLHSTEDGYEVIGNIHENPELCGEEEE